MPSSLAQKLQIKSGRSLAVLDAPAGYVDSLTLPSGTVAATAPAPRAKYDVVQVFVGRKLDVAKRAVKAGRLVKDGGAFWVAYPKKSAKVDTDLSRDAGWDALAPEGWDVVAVISLDATWSALRFTKNPDLRASRAARATKPRAKTAKKKTAKKKTAKKKTATRR